MNIAEAGGATTGQGAQVWAIVRSSDPASTLENVLAQPQVDGVVLYMGVSRLMPAPGVYDWSLTDHAFQQARAAGKPVKLALVCGRWVPQWIYDNGAETIRWTFKTPYVDAGQSEAKAPLPWDDVYLSAIEDLARASARRYGQEPLLRSVQVTGPSISNGLEMDLSISAEQAAQIGYEPQKLINAWKRMTDAFATAFPEKEISLALHNHVAGERTLKIANPVKAHALDSIARDSTRVQSGGGLGLLVCYATHADWFAPGNSAVDIWLTPARKGVVLEAQLIDLHSAKNADPQLAANAISRARAMGAARIEVFAADMLSAPHRDAIAAAARK